MLSELHQQEFWLLQFPFWCTIIGIYFLTINWFKDDPGLVRKGLMALMFSGLAAIPLYFIGQDIIQALTDLGRSKAQIEQYEQDYYTTLIVFMFMSITALMSWLMKRALDYVPKFFLALLHLYGIVVVLYTGWRQWAMF
jgi:hypothetical protein